MSALSERWPALEARELSFTFRSGARPALERVTLRVEAGHCAGLLGVNGAGKSTFVNLVAGLLTPDSGELTVFGQRCGTRGARTLLGLCPQELALFTTLSALENLRAFARLAGLSGARLAQCVERALVTVGLRNEADQRVERLSGGMKRRLNLAVALLHEPRLLVLDEPTVGVDVQSRLALFATLEELVAGGTSVLYATHYMEEVERLCDAVLVLDRGRVIAAGPTATLGGEGAQRFALTLAPGADGRALAREAEARGLRARIVAGELELFGDDLRALTALLARWTDAGFVLACATRRATLEERFLALTTDERR
jgi:ABC-2 type transport system ATP-binding protein